MAKPPNIQAVVPTPESIKAENPADYAERGYLYFSQKKFDQASEDFRHVVGLDASNLEAWYGLGLALKGAAQNTQAIDAFEHVLNLLGNIEDHQRANVLGRLVKGHINQLKTGDWNLEKEVWKSVK